MRFFFYGTLMAGSGSRMARLVERRLRPLGPATATGVLHAIPDPRGWYPALLRGDGVVRGQVHEGALTERELASLDRYEDYDPGRPAASLYVRNGMAVRLADGSPGEAQAYFYNRALPEGARPIGADFQAWLASEGLRAFGSEG